MDNNMLKFIKIRNSYTIPKIVELSINEKALLEYEKFCLELMNQVKKQKEVIDKAIEYLEEPNRDSFDYSKALLLDILKDKEVSE